MSWRVLAFAFLALWDLPAKAGPVFTSTTEMVSACRYSLRERPQNPETIDLVETARALSCISYLFGFIGGYYHGTMMYKNRPMFICFPSNPTSQQLATIYVQWAEKNANKWHEPVWNTVVMAFAEAFPCEDPLR